MGLQARNNLHPRPKVTQPADPSYRYIALTQGQVTAVDTADYDWLSQWVWYAWWNPNGKCYYAVRTDYDDPLKRRRRVYMHRAIAGSPMGLNIDHEDRDTLNNRRSNLRAATTSQNACNRGRQRDNTSGFKGVSWISHDRRWIACIKVNRRNRYLGAFKNPEDAAHAYDTAARRLHGEFAGLNFPIVS